MSSIQFTCGRVDPGVEVREGVKSFTVALPEVSAQELRSAGSTAGTTRFSIAVSGPVGAVVSILFGPGATTDMSTGNLVVAPGQSAATNVQISLLNDSMVRMNLASGEQGSQRVAIGPDGVVELSYFAGYVASGVPVTAGVANSSVTYSVVVH